MQKISCPFQAQLSRPQTSNVTHLVSAKASPWIHTNSLPHVLPAPLQGHPRLVFAVRFCETSAFAFARDAIFLKDKPWR